MPGGLRKLFRRRAKIRDHETEDERPSVASASEITTSNAASTQPQAGPQNDTYHYSPLAEHAMRILMPSAYHAHLSCELRECSTQSEMYNAERTPYIALSYEWGSNDKTETMTVHPRDGNEDAGTIAITKSLYCALDDLKNSKLLMPSCANDTGIFADQVCINQSDVHEVSVQVAQMGRIYKQADQVVTYLGPWRTGDKAGFELIEEIYERFKSHVHSLQPSHARQTRGSSTDLQSLKMKISPTHPGLESLRDMMWGAWTRRLWMLPENMLNSRTCFLRGTKVVDWDVIVPLHMLAELNLIGPAYLFKNPHPADLMGTSGSLTAQSIWNVRMFSAGQMDLTDNMTAFAAAKCCDERDKVYALLSMSRDAIELEIEPDYSKAMTVRKLYGEVVVTASTYHNSLAAIEVAEQFRNGQQWQSWVPDWRVQRQLLVPFASNLKRSRKDHSSEGFSFQWTKDQRRQLCIVTGTIYDRIEHILSAEPLYNLMDETRSIVDSRNGWLTVKQSIDSAIAHGFDYQTIARVLSASQNSDPNTASGDIHYSTSTMQKSMQYYASRFDQPTANKALSVDGPMFVDSSEGDDSFFRQASCMINRKLVVTERNHLCLANAQTEIDDIVAVINQASSPWIVRPVAENHFRLIELAHVQVMDYDNVYVQAIRKFPLI